jgi:phenylalanyl-tRNA synthetase beta chain
VRRAGEVLVGRGFCEAMTRSVVDESLAAIPSPWGEAAPLVIAPPLVRGADRLRRSLLPSLLEARGDNLAVGNHDADLFEVARAYLARSIELPAGGPVNEPLLVALVTGCDFFRGKGITEAILTRLGVGGEGSPVVCRPLALEPFARGRTAELVLERPGREACRVGVVGEIAEAACERFSLAGPLVGAELRLDLLDFAVAGQKRLERPAEFPAVERDLNLVVDEAVAWGDLERAIRGAAGGLLEACRVVEVWRHPERLGAGKKSLVVAVTLRSRSGTLTGEEAGRIVADIVAACGRECAATLRG